MASLVEQIALQSQLGEGDSGRPGQAFLAGARLGLARRQEKRIERQFEETSEIRKKEAESTAKLRESQLLEQQRLAKAAEFTAEKNRLEQALKTIDFFKGLKALEIQLADQAGELGLMSKLTDLTLNPSLVNDGVFASETKQLLASVSPKSQAAEAVRNQIAKAKEYTDSEEKKRLESEMLRLSVDQAKNRMTETEKLDFNTRLKAILENEMLDETGKNRAINNLLNTLSSSKTGLSQPSTIEEVDPDDPMGLGFGAIERDYGPPIPRPQEAFVQDIRPVSEQLQGLSLLSKPKEPEKLRGQFDFKGMRVPKGL